MTKKFAKCFLVVFILISLIIPSCLTAFAADTVTISLEVKYGQTEARAMLDMINSFRTGSEAWYWNESNTEKIYKNNLSKLNYDYGLEEIAMQRAAEIAVSFSHTRPDGSSCFTAKSKSGHTSYGENIAYGYSSASSVFVAWREDNDKYSGQGHRRNMLNEGFTQVGIGHAVVNGKHYWVQEFGYSSTGTAKTSAEDGYKTVKIDAVKSLADQFTTTTTTTKPSTTKQTTTNQTTTKQTTTKQTSTTKPTTTKSTTTTKNTTTTTKPTNANTTTTTKANSTTKADSNTVANSTTEATSAANTSSITEATTTDKASSASNTQSTEPTTVEPSSDKPLAEETPTTEIASEQAPNKNGAALYIGMATAGVLAAAGICVFIFIRSRKK